MNTTFHPDAIQTAANHTRDLLALAIGHTDEAAAVVVWDGDSELSRALTEAYRLSLPDATFIDFNATEADAIRASFEDLHPGDLVVMIQSTSFRLDAFRIRIELFNRSLKVVEHPHLARMTGEEALIYIESLAYDPAYFRGVGHALKARLDEATVGIVQSAGAVLTFPVGFESAKMNIGDYTGMKNIGGQFPIGEVFTESRDLEAVHGRLTISFFGDTSFNLKRPPHPITLVIEKGRVVATENSTEEFEEVLECIRRDDGEVWLRELGLGMNRAFTQDRTVLDIGTFERMCGVHVSLGSKHAMYNKPNIRKKTAKHHVDVFAVTERVLLDGDVIYEDGNWVV
ncbi:hypothetical protein Poly30_07530 [Planctomycetes bacterium Poly30]|uniref:2,5-dihydroxypyridine 5,6-dioxygenase n=1 Tax=Saltatorellus ferox TaxID=2528018 RepID=A0A518EME5_9BACT|nr:hypothetical protein Poly30_07530 [Planctomycetes bacterium Poly30]